MSVSSADLAVSSPQLNERAPFAPGQIFSMSFFFSPFCAAIMAGLNWKRMGYPGRAWNPILQVMLFFSIVSIGNIFRILQTQTEIRPASTADFILYAGSGLLFTGWITWRHRYSRHDWLAARGIPSYQEQDGYHTYAKIIFGALALNGLLMLIIVPYVIAPASLIVLNIVAPSSAFEGERVTFDYSVKWREFPLKEDPFCQQEGVECIFGALTVDNINPALGVQFQVDRLHNTGLAALVSGILDAEDFALVAKQQITQQNRNIRWINESAVQIDEHDAYKLVFEMAGERQIMFFIKDGRAIVRFVAFGPASHFESLQTELEGIAHSIRFTS
jgi:hypothetical protein